MADDDDVIYLPLDIPVPRYHDEQLCQEYVREDWASDALLVPCGRPAYGHTGLCPAHYKRSRDQVPMDLPHRPRINPRRTAEEISFRDAEGKKQCGTCRQFLPEDEFSSRIGTPDNLAYQCQLCINLLRYGLTRNTAQARLSNQDGRCANSGCRSPIEIRARRVGSGRSQSRVGLACVDHDHDCCPGDGSCGKCVRGFLCWHCNSAAGLLRDDPDRIGGLSEYMRRPVSELRAV